MSVYPTVEIILQSHVQIFIAVLKFVNFVGKTGNSIGFHVLVELPGSDVDTASKKKKVK